MPDPVVGAAGSESHTAEEIVREVRDVIYRVAGDARLAKFLAAMPKKRVTNPKVEWNQRREPQTNTKSASAETAGATSVDLQGTDYLNFQKEDLLQIQRTGEMVRVTETPTTATVAIERGIGSTAQAILVGDEIVRISNAWEEGDSIPQGVATKSDPLFNNTQIIKEVFEVTNTAMVTRMYGGTIWQKHQADAMFRHLHAIERALIFSYRTNVTGANGKPKRTMRGLIHYMTGNAVNLDNRTFNKRATRGIFENIIAPMAWRFNDGMSVGIRPNALMCFCSKAWLSAIQAIARDAGEFQRDPASETFGFRIMAWDTVFGTFKFVEHPMFTGERWGGLMLIVNMNQLRYCFLAGRDTFVKPNVQLRKEDLRQDLILTECSVEAHNVDLLGTKVEGLHAAY